MPQYESNQAVVGFLRRLKAGFSGFNTQTIQMAGQPVQMVHGAALYKKNKIFLALFTSPVYKRDTLVVSLALFHVPELGAEELFEQLLSWNNGATETVRFTIDEVINTINLVCVRPTENLSFEEFQQCLDSIVSVAQNCAERLQREYGVMRIA